MGPDGQPLGPDGMPLLDSNGQPLGPDGMPLDPANPADGSPLADDPGAAADQVPAAADEGANPAETAADTPEAADQPQADDPQADDGTQADDAEEGSGGGGDGFFGFPSFPSLPAFPSFFSRSESWFGRNARNLRRSRQLYSPCQDRITLPCVVEDFIGAGMGNIPACIPVHCGNSMCQSGISSCKVETSITPFALGVHFGNGTNKGSPEDNIGACIRYNQAPCSDN